MPARAPAARLFAAVELPLQAREALAGWGRGLLGVLREAGGGGTAQGLRVLDPESMHLTLCFLGSRPVGEIEPLSAAVEAFEGEACALALGAPVWLPRRRPRALAVEVADPAGALTDVRERLAQGFSAACGWQPERRRFRPHVTVARVKGRAGLAAGVVELPPSPAAAFDAGTLTLYRSRLAPSGASYEPLASVTLAPG